ncbi:ABC transporter G family member 9-like [Branchiostoma floridae]|uniref:ABC transporter G family member 9-like n=1 Tax=Branchiostoma floridae TaxID=7739 RepID=A0A9J7N4H5_BRAFL|nr:ABC transporter G family member 9-like [Branchiostoma floridae]
MFTAMLRLPEKMPYHQKEKKVEEIVDALDIRKCLDTLIGTDLKRGLSGGEKKRANIASELLTDPSLMLLDEPTSGLDSSTAYSLMTTVKHYTEQHNKTVVTTIHQPSSQIYHMFDKLLLMADGEIAYFGDAHNILEFFSRLGMQPKPNYNPADFILEKVKESEEVEKKIISASNEMRKVSPLSPLTDSSETFSTSRKNSTQNGGIGTISGQNHRNGLDPKDVHLNHLPNGAVAVDMGESDKEAKWPTGFLTQYKVLTQRNFKEAKPRLYSRLNWIQNIAVTLILALVWFQTSLVEEKIRDVSGAIFFLITYWGFMPMADALLAFPSERLVVNKERLAGSYRLSSYYLAKVTSEAPLMLLLPTVMISVCYPMCGFGNAAGFFSTWILLMLSALTAQSIGFFMSSVFFEFREGLVAVSVFMLSNLLLGGFYNTDIPFFLSSIGFFMSSVFFEFREGLVAVSVFMLISSPQSIGFFMSSVFFEFREGLVAVSVFMLSNLLLGGFYNTDIPFWLDWVQYFAFLNYSFQAQLNVHFTPNHLYRCSTDKSLYNTCIDAMNSTSTEATVGNIGTAAATTLGSVLTSSASAINSTSQMILNTTTQATTSLSNTMVTNATMVPPSLPTVHIPPEEVLQQLGATFPMWVNIVVMLGIMFVFRYLGYLVLRYFRKPE